MQRRGPAVHRTIVAVDVEGFGDRNRTNVHQVAVRDGLYRALRQAFENARISRSACEWEDRGDGVFILAPADMPKAPFVDTFPAGLVAALREHNTEHPVEERIRLRMVLHAGEVSYDEYGVTAVSVNLAFRLLDAAPVRAALAESPGVLVVVASEWFFDEVIRHSYVTDPATFRPARVAVKETSAVGWIGLPDFPYPPDRTQLAARSLPVGPVPHELPAAPRSFTGRADELARLTGALGDAAGRGRTVMISAIAGAGGMGKTWLALRWAHEHLDQFPDGQLFVDLRGFSPDSEPMSPGVAVRGFLDAIGVDPAQVPADLHTQVARYRSLVAGKRMLIVLDNAADTSQITPLLPGSPTCAVLVTSRNRLPGLITAHGARHVPVDVLGDTEARSLLATRLGAERIAAEPEAVEVLLNYCGGYPLALSIVAGRAHTQPHVSLATLAAELRSAGLDAFDNDDPAASLPAVLSWSYHALSQEQANAFMLLSIAPGPDIDLPAAAELTGLPRAEAKAVLRGLVQVSLLDQDSRGRYLMHDLIRRYAADRAISSQPETDREVALRRVVDFYLHTAYTGDRLLAPHRQAIQIASASQPQQFRDEAGAMDWFVAEHACLVATAHLAAAHGWHAAVWQLAWTLTTFQWRQGYLQHTLAVCQAELAAADHLADPVVQARAHRHLGHACAQLGRHSEALEHLRRALVLARQTGDVPAQARAQRALAWAWGQQGDLRQALEHATLALHLFQGLDNLVWQADILNDVGWYAAQLGEYDQARAQCGFALMLHRHQHNRDGEATALESLGYIAYRTGQHTHAVDYYQQALTLLRQLGNAYKEARALENLGHPLVVLGQRDRVRAVWEDAIELYQTQHRTTEADRVRHQLDTLARRTK